jgi:hypothetical protein
VYLEEAIRQLKQTARDYDYKFTQTTTNELEEHYSNISTDLEKPMSSTEEKTLLDEFAMVALPCILASIQRADTISVSDSAEQLAKTSYRLARQMMIQREIYNQ